jgi:tRNA(Arg) A34 adenosine deaminase TadA
MSDETFIKRCYELAEQAVSLGNHPFAALLMVNGEVVLETLNTVITDSDVTGHAELNLIRDASKRFGAEVFAKATLYASTEPCAMCSGAIYWAGVTRLVFGVSGADLAQIAGESFVWSSSELYTRSNRSIEVVGPVLATTGRKTHQSFWT